MCFDDREAFSECQTAEHFKLDTLPELSEVKEQPAYWDRGRPARNERSEPPAPLPCACAFNAQAPTGTPGAGNLLALRARCGRDAHGPSNRLSQTPDVAELLWHSILRFHGVVVSPQHAKSRIPRNRNERGGTRVAQRSIT